MKKTIVVVLVILLLGSMFSVSAYTSDSVSVESFVQEQGISVNERTEIRAVLKYNQKSDTICHCLEVVNYLDNGIIEKSYIIPLSAHDGDLAPTVFKYSKNESSRDSGWVTFFSSLDASIVTQAYYSGSGTNYVLLYGVAAYWTRNKPSVNLNYMGVTFQAAGYLVDLSTGVVNTSSTYYYYSVVSESNPYANTQYADYSSLPIGYGLRTSGLPNGGGALYVSMSISGGGSYNDSISLF